MWFRLRSFALDYLIADVPPLSREECWRSIMATVIGLMIASALALYLPAPLGERWLLAPIGASAIILFVVPQSPLAQPWSVFGGFFFAALSAALWRALFPEFLPLAAVFAAAMAVGLMTWLRCVHPPAGALAYVLAFSPHAGLAGALGVLIEIILDASFLVIAALIVNNLIFRRNYPHCRATTPENPHHTSDALPTARLGLNHTDLEAAMQKLDTFVDVQEAQLVEIYNHAVDHAFNRHVAMTCGDIMASSVVSVEFATPLEAAWQTFRAHKIKALPVVDRSSQRLLGIITVADFLKQIDTSRAAALAGKMQKLLSPTRRSHSKKPEVVGQVMTPKPYAVSPETPILELIRRLSDMGMHHVPVIDERSRVIGMITQSDLIAALYKQVALAQSGPA